MFGVTTPCVQQLAAALERRLRMPRVPRHRHRRPVDGEAGRCRPDPPGVIDITTTEVCDLLFGGVFPATEDRFGAIIRKRIPYVGSVGALDMVNFGAPDTVPERYRGRKLHVHNPQVTLMRTTAEENAAMGRWIGERLNRMDGPVRFFLPEGGVSALDAPGQPFYDPAADAALFDALEKTVRQTANRQLIRSSATSTIPNSWPRCVAAFRAIVGRAGARRRAAR